MKFDTVTKKGFEEFITTYPRELKIDVYRIHEPRCNNGNPCDKCKSIYNNKNGEANNDR